MVTSCRLFSRAHSEKTRHQADAILLLVSFSSPGSDLIRIEREFADFIWPEDEKNQSETGCEVWHYSDHFICGGRFSEPTVVDKFASLVFLYSGCLSRMTADLLTRKWRIHYVSILLASQMPPVLVP
jgi:hypothetical protein